MPLEQIRSVGALNSSESLRRASYFDYPSSSTASSPFARDEADSGSDAEHDDHDGDDAYKDRYKRYSASSRKSESMSLAKLGGVGGVTRSGSWGRNSLPENSLSSRQAGANGKLPSYKAVRSSLSHHQESDVEEETSFAAHDRAASSGLPTTSVTAIGMPERRSSEGDSQSLTSADAPDLSNPPTSSRTSTASSAAAFSLRSLSNRNSTGSVSSLASSVVSRGELDRLTPAPPSEGSASLDHVQATKSDSEPTVTSSSSSTSATAPSSPVRVQSSDITSNAADADPHQSEGSQVSREDDMVSSQPVAAPEVAQLQQQDTALQPSPIIAASPALPPPSNSRPAAFNNSADPETGGLLSPQIASPPARGRHFLASPIQGGLQPSAEELLTSTAGRMYSPLVPRRHSGMIMLRSRSQLALHPGLAMTFANAEGGRAAARERARKQTGWENAPFSVLEAQRHAHSYAFSQPASPGQSSHAVAWDPSASPGALQPAAKVSEPGLVRSPQMSSRSAEPLAPSPLSSPQPQPLARSMDLSEQPRRPGPPARQKSEHTLSRAALARIDTVLRYYGGDAAVDPNLPSSADAATTSMPVGARPQALRSPSGSGIVGPNSVLRTPTTEEWSRYLESQGVGRAERRSRSGTGMSSSSAAQRAGRLALSGPQSTGRGDFDSNGGDYDDEDSDVESDDSDDHDLGVEVMEKLKQLGISRAASRAGSVLGDELASLHEEDEDDLSPVSPQLDQILPHHDPTPLTPLASVHKTLPPSQSTPGNKLNGSPMTPQPILERGTTVRLPRSKRPTVSGESQGAVQAFPHNLTGEKTIADFEIVSDVGRGAYGLVKKARMRGPDGRGQGDEVVIKYIIKSRILADCWRRHRVLGPIPVEIHVMDQLKRMAYVPPPRTRPWSAKRPKTLEEYRARKRLDAELEATAAQMRLPHTTAAAGSHPNICKMLDFFEDHEFYYLVMPCFGRGQDLFDYVESAPDGLAASQCRSIFGQVADALWFLHANNIVHRDIKDENVVLDGEGNAQLIDFGSAAHVRPGKLFDTFSGTLDYAAAEILQGEKYAGKAQDVWALGVVGFVLGRE